METHLIGNDYAFNRTSFLYTVIKQIFSKLLWHHVKNKCCFCLFRRNNGYNDFMDSSELKNMLLSCFVIDINKLYK